MDKKVLVLDIDGTLTNAKKEITPRTKRAIFDMQKKGHKIVLASGRPTAGVWPIAEKLKLSEYGGYILSFNGAKVIQCQTKEIISQNVIPKELIPDIYQAAVIQHTGLISYSERTILAATEIDEYIRLEAKINHMEIENVENFIEYISFPITKCLMTGPGEHMEVVEQRLKKQFEGKLSIYRSEPFFLEIMPMNVDKAFALETLSKYLNLTREHFISCGDGFNDVTMIEFAGLGVAMENAQEKVKKAADYITKSNEEDGVASVIEQFILKEDKDVIFANSK